jgi:hypothetical protein
MTENEALAQLSLADRLELVAFDLELRRAPRALIEALWQTVDKLPEADLRKRKRQP